MSHRTRHGDKNSRYEHESLRGRSTFLSSPVVFAEAAIVIPRPERTSVAWRFGKGKGGAVMKCGVHWPLGDALDFFLISLLVHKRIGAGGV